MRIEQGSPNPARDISGCTGILSIMNKYIDESSVIRQASKQLGTPGGAKSFLREVQNFQTSAILSNYVQHIFPEEKKIVGRPSSPGYGPGNISRNNNITQDVRPSNCRAVSYVALKQKSWRPLV